MERRIPEGVKHDTSNHPHAKNYKIEIFIKLNRGNSKLSFVFLLTADSRKSCFLSCYLEKSQESALHLSSCRDTADKKEPNRGFMQKSLKLLDKLKSFLVGTNMPVS